MLRRTFLGILAAIPFWRKAKAEPSGETRFEYGFGHSHPWESVPSNVPTISGCTIKINCDGGWSPSNASDAAVLRDALEREGKLRGIPDGAIWFL